MNNTEFLTRGPEVPSFYISPLTGVKFISISGRNLEFIGEIVQIVDGVAIVKDPILVSRDQKDIKRFNFIVFHDANPIVNKEIQVPLSNMAFMCTPEDVFIKNYMAARAGLVTAASFNDSNNSSLKR
jgi:hypothetical protein